MKLLSSIFTFDESVDDLLRLSIGGVFDPSDDFFDDILSKITVRYDLSAGQLIYDGNELLMDYDEQLPVTLCQLALCSLSLSLLSAYYFSGFLLSSPFLSS